MLKIKRLFYLAIFIAYQNNLTANLLDEGILEKNTSNNSCLVYQPYLGVVDDIESLDIKSDKFEVTDDERIFLYGDVVLDFPDGILKTGKAKIDRKNGLVDFEGNGYLFLNDYFFKSQKGSFNRDEGSLELNKGEAYLNERNLIFNFDELIGNIKDKITFKQASMTSCENPSDGWELVADKIEIDDKTNRGYLRKVRIKLFDKTIMGLPYVPFPISTSRMSGFLEPKLSYSSDGLDFIIPYFKVISDKSDITLALRNISEKGLGLEGNYRTLHGDNKNLRNLDFIYFNKDKEYREFYPTRSDTRWAFLFQDSFKKTKNSWIDIDWSKASDSLVLRDINGDTTSIGDRRTQNLNQSIIINRVLGDLSIQIKQQGFQTLNPILTNGYKTSPSINLIYYKDFRNFTFREKLNISYFKADETHAFFGLKSENNKFLTLIDNPVEGSRTFSDLSIANQAFINGINIKTTFGLKNIHYNLKNRNLKTKSISVPNFKLDISSLFYRKSKESIHILRPRFLYGYVGYENQENNPIFDTNKNSMMNQLFNINRFAGMDRIGDQKFYTLSVEYKKRQMNMDKISLRISKKLYLADRKVWVEKMHMNTNMMSEPMDEGPLMIMGHWMPSMNTKLMTYASYNEESKKIPMKGITLKHSFESGSFGYSKRYNKMSGDFNVMLDYSELFVDLKIKENLSFITLLKRDDESNTNIDSLIGLSYENCCFVFRITASERNLSKYLDGKDKSSYTYLNDAWGNIIRIENKSRINFQYEFKGFNSSLGKIKRFIENSTFNH